MLDRWRVEIQQARSLTYSFSWIERQTIEGMGRKITVTPKVIDFRTKHRTSWKRNRRIKKKQHRTLSKDKFSSKSERAKKINWKTANKRKDIKSERRTCQ